LQLRDPKVGVNCQKTQTIQEIRFVAQKIEKNIANQILNVCRIKTGVFNRQTPIFIKS